jgi:hypothetical protein
MVLPRHFPGGEANKKKMCNCPIAMTQSKLTTALAERHYRVVIQTWKNDGALEPDCSLRKIRVNVSLCWFYVVCSGWNYTQRDESFCYACTVTILDTRTSHLLCLLINTYNVKISLIFATNICLNYIEKYFFNSCSPRTKVLLYLVHDSSWPMLFLNEVIIFMSLGD